MNNSDHSDIVEDFVRRIVELENYIENLKKRADCAEDALDGMKNLNVENKDDQLLIRIREYESTINSLNKRIEGLTKSIEYLSKQDTKVYMLNDEVKKLISENNSLQARIKHISRPRPWFDAWSTGT